MDSPKPTVWADVVLPCPPYKTLTYRVPEAFTGDVLPGFRVLIPLGKRKVTGVVSRLLAECAVPEARDIEDVLDPWPALSEDMLELTRWVADYYLAEWGEAVRAALPPGFVQGSKPVFKITGGETQNEAKVTERDLSLFRLLSQKKDLTIRALARSWGGEGIYFALGRLEKAGLIRQQQRFEDAGNKVQTETWVTLKKTAGAEEMETLQKKAKRQVEALQALQRFGGEARLSDLRDADLQVLKRLARSGWIEIWEEEVFRDGYRDIEPEPFVPNPLTPFQVRAFGQIDAFLKRGGFGVFLVHGVTGSGKTRLYIEVVRSALEQGKSALVLIPEISLTPQAVARYRGAFGNRIAVLHSGMSAGERHDSWRKIRDGSCRIALGPRSAVFAPLRDLGLIVVDEEHEASYKQNDPSPRYHARDTAVMRGFFLRCPVLLGSATPSLESYSNALAGKYTLVRLPERVDGIPMPAVVVADPRETRKENPFLTSVLRQKIKERLALGEQTILLLNRRGYASYLQCGSCGAIETCPHCAISLTFHRQNRLLKCHYCGFSKPAQDACPECGGSRLKLRGMGTERIEEEIKTCFPGARLVRMDLDTTRRKGAHARIISGFWKKESDILLGTQMVAKGHDFPGVSLVGIISADTGLYFPDFRSEEKTFQLLTQAAGRAGRGGLTGEVVIQTMTPDHTVILFSQKHDYEAFYHWAVEQRKELGYPPFGRLVLAGFRCADEKKASEAAQFFFDSADFGNRVERLGPVPAPLSKIQGQYRFHIIFRQSKNLDPNGKWLRDRLRAAMHHFKNTARFRNVRMHLDVDPSDML